MFGSVEYALPANEQKGLGIIILAPNSEHLIQGVQVSPYILWPDDRGYFLEVARLRHGCISDFPCDSAQISMAQSLPGTIKAFHIHREQTDYWAPVAGLFQVALVDLRPDSTTFGLRNTFYVGALRPWQILIPPGIGHGYKVISQEPGVVLILSILSSHAIPSHCSGHLPLERTMEPDGLYSCSGILHDSTVSIFLAHQGRAACLPKDPGRPTLPAYY